MQIHEIGHAVEYVLIPKYWGTSRARAEGFATWFETYASDFSPMIPRGSVRKKMFARAQQSFAAMPGGYTFQGSAHDYARASMYFHALSETKRPRGVMEVYDIMNTKRLSYFDAVEDRYGWSKEELEKKIFKILR